MVESENWIEKSELIKWAHKYLKIPTILKDLTNKKIFAFIQKKPRTKTEIANHIKISYRNVLARLNKLGMWGIIEMKDSTNNKGNIVLINLKEKKIEDLEKNLFKKMKKDFYMAYEKDLKKKTSRKNG